MGKKLGKKNTAKRKIQIREYFAKQMQTKRYYSDPLIVSKKDLESDSDEISIFDDTPSKKLDINVQKENESENDDVILSGNINLDDADRFINSLSLKKKKKAAPKKPVVAPRILYKETISFKKQTENLARLREVEAQGNEEEEDENIM